MFMRGSDMPWLEVLRSLQAESYKFASTHIQTVLNTVDGLARPNLQDLFAIASGLAAATQPISGCPGYVASKVHERPDGFNATLKLKGDACDIYGKDIPELEFRVQCQTKTRVHVQIFDPDLEIYQVPESVLPRPEGAVDCDTVDLEVALIEDPFSFSVRRQSNGDVIFNSAGSPLVFEDQYWNLRTSLPEDPNLYGLGDHTDALKLNTTSYTRTLWNRDAGAVPEGENLYGAHPVYFENRPTPEAHAHGVALINSNGMDIKINKSQGPGHYLEYNVLGGIIDLYFLSGPNPLELARQYSEVSGKPAMMPYWGLGFHNCKFGYSSVEELVEVVANYSKASIPLETMWTDIDYMDEKKVFTLGDRFPLAEMRKMINQLHENDQHYVVMVDPAVAYQNYGPFERGEKAGTFLKNSTYQVYQAVVWPGVSAYPDWFHEDTQAYWSYEIAKFFDSENGVDIDALWIDMNEPANFCIYPCLDPDKEALLVDRGLDSPDQRPWTGEPHSRSSHQLSDETKKGLPGRNLLNPKYRINNMNVELSNRTANTSIVHANGLVMYDTHNLYGTMMSSVSQVAMLERRPSRRPLVITRSTFIGAGTRVGHWLGDNWSTWYHYRQSIRHMLQFTAFFQMPMTGADICGFGRDTTETLCARWARLGAFSPFMRNHNIPESIPQEFYRWPQVAESARKAIDLRYRLLDYIYSAMYLQTVDGTPLVTPLWMLYPEDSNTSAIELQFFYGPALLVSPVVEENSTEVSIFLPNDDFYELETSRRVQRGGSFITLSGVGYTDIPVHVRAGYIIPMRVSSANTTTELRTKNFELLVAPNKFGKAYGYLYLDDGDSLVQAETSEIHFTFEDGKLSMDGDFSYQTDLLIEQATLLGDGSSNSQPDVLVAVLNWDLTGRASKTLQ